MTEETLPILFEAPWIIYLAQGWQMPFIAEPVQWNAGRWVVLLWRSA